MTSAVAVSEASEESRSGLALNVASPEATIIASARGAGAAAGRGRLALGWIEDAGLLVLLVLAFPLLIVVVGAPVALVVRLLIEIGRRW
jgi:hypothetical protein